MKAWRVHEWATRGMGDSAQAHLLELLAAQRI